MINETFQMQLFTCENTFLEKIQIQSLCSTHYRNLIIAISFYFTGKYELISANVWTPVQTLAELASKSGNI